MKGLVRVLISLSVLSLFVSCSNTWEGKGDAAYSKAQKTSGDEKRLQLKTAYIMYQKAINARPDKISTKLRNRYLEMTLFRSGMVINEGTASMDALPLYMEDVEKFLTPESPAELKQQYAMLLTQMADSSASNDKFDEAMAQIDKASKFASDPTPVNNRRNVLMGKITKDNFELADMEYTDGMTNKDPDQLVRAEYHVLVTMMFDSTYEGAAKLLSDIRKENKSTYSAYKKVIEHIPDSAVFRKINKYDILLAVPTFGGTSAVVNIYNYSYNPLRLKTEQFYIVDISGNKYQAKPGPVDPEILDQEHEAKVNLTFPKPSQAVEKLIYQNEEHFAEKRFM